MKQVQLEIPQLHESNLDPLIREQLDTLLYWVLLSKTWSPLDRNLYSQIELTLKLQLMMQETR
jgi:hypothetical protein